MKRSNLILIFVILAVVLAISLIEILKNNNSINEQDVKCIASKSRLFVSKTCGHCAMQKQILGNYTIYFNTTECIDNSQECINNGIEFVPAWIINEKKYTGVKSLEELKKLAEC
jgi:glutaredoxin